MASFLFELLYNSYLSNFVFTTISLYLFIVLYDLVTVLTINKEIYIDSKQMMTKPKDCDDSFIDLLTYKCNN